MATSRAAGQSTTPVDAPGADWTADHAARRDRTTDAETAHDSTPASGRTATSSRGAVLARSGVALLCGSGPLGAGGVYRIVFDPPGYEQQTVPEFPLSDTSHVERMYRIALVPPSAAKV